MPRLCLVFFFALLLGVTVLTTSLPPLARAQAQDGFAAHIRIDAGAVRGGDIAGAMYGSCIEDVNHEIYGGLYDQKIFGESFEEPTPPDKITGWTAYGGEWQSTLSGTQGCSVRAEWGAKLVHKSDAFANGVVEAEVRLDGKGRTDTNAGLLVRIASPGVGADNFDGYEISLMPGGQVILGRHRHDWRSLASAASGASVTPRTWNRLRIALDGARIRVYVNDHAAPAIDFTDADHPILSGKTALRTWGGDAAFRNVRVQPKEDVSPTALTFPTVPVPRVSGMWDAVQTGDAAARFALSTDSPFHGSSCQQIEHGAGTGRVGVANRGLNRWGIAVARGQTFAGHVYLRGKIGVGGASRPPAVTVALQSADGARTYAARTIDSIAMGWKRCDFTLTANATDPNARFALWLDSPGTVEVDQTVLMGTGAERFRGLPVRADIARAIVAGGVRFLRYGGTMVNVPGYRWKSMIGDRDRRPPYRGNWYPYSTNGFGIFDFLDFCEAAGIESAFAINIEETDQDAADLADYLTAPIANAWGRRRAEDGHPTPYKVRYIEIGNEEVIGDGRDARGYAHYADRFRALAQAIHGRNPALPLVCAAWWVPDSPSMKPVFDAVDGVAAAWDLHVDSDAANAGTAVDARLTQMQSLFRQWNPQTALQCVVFEENGGRHDLQRALGHATTLNATRRHSDFVRADCPANCLQPLGQNSNGWDQGQIFFTPDKVWAMLPYNVQQMASQNALPLRVGCALTEDGGGADVRQHLDLLATRSTDGKTCVLSVVNTGAMPVSATIALNGFVGIAAHASVTTLAGPPDAVNPPDGPPTVAPKSATLDVQGDAQGGTARATFPAYSYTILRFSR